MSAADRLEAIRARHADGDPGPWTWTTELGFPVVRDAEGLEVAQTTYAAAKRVANAPADIAFLLAEVDRLQAQLADHDAVLDTLPTEDIVNYLEDGFGYHCFAPGEAY